MATKKGYIDEVGLRTFASEVKDFVEKKVASSGGGGAVTSVNGKTGAVVLDKADVGLENAVEKSDILDENNKILTGKLPDFIFGQLLFGGLIKMGGTTISGKVKPSAAFKSRFNLNYDTIDITSGQAATYGNVYFIVQDFTGQSTYTNQTILGVESVSTGDWIISTGDNWEKVDNTDAVKTVAGRTGDIVLKVEDITDLDVDGIINSAAARAEANSQTYTQTYVAGQRQDNYITDNTDDLKLASVGAVRTYVSTKIQEAITSALNTAV
jgi:hypothetical protein